MRLPRRSFGKAVREMNDCCYIDSCSLPRHHLLPRLFFLIFFLPSRCHIFLPPLFPSFQCPNVSTLRHLLLLHLILFLLFYLQLRAPMFCRSATTSSLFFFSSSSSSPLSALCFIFLPPPSPLPLPSLLAPFLVPMFRFSTASSLSSSSSSSFPIAPYLISPLLSPPCPSLPFFFFLFFLPFQCPCSTPLPPPFLLSLLPPFSVSLTLSSSPFSSLLSFPACLAHSTKSPPRHFRTGLSEERTPSMFKGLFAVRGLVFGLILHSSKGYLDSYLLIKASIAKHLEACC